MKTGRWGWLAALVLFSFAVHAVLLVNSVETEVWNEQSESGALLAEQLADAAAPAVLGHDMVSLSVLASRFEDHPDVQTVMLIDASEHVLAQIGVDAASSGRRFAAPVVLNGQTLGRVSLQLALPSRGQIIRNSLGNLALSGLLHLILLGVALSLRAAADAPAMGQAARRTPQAPVAATQPEPAVEPAQVQQPASLLHLGLDDPNHLLTRVNATTADELLTVLDHLLDRAARLYGGEIIAPFSPTGTLVAFHQPEAVDRAFQALMCGQLFLQLTAGADQQRRAAGLFSLPVKAGVHHTDNDTPENRQIAAILALAAPSGRLLSSSDLLDPAALARCHAGQSLSLALGAGRELPIVVIERLQAEYQQLVHNQSQQLLGLNVEGMT
jgi:hypothetical protein